ncbi:MAG: beta-N-acetylhexosaminidase [Bdellovibrionales bacterium]|nr:beta-N-acetylhexosaminidase [Bdellovibrionales bacterium]
MSKVDLGKLVGQSLIVGFEGTSIDKKTLDLLAKVGVGGVILFKQNYESLAQLVELTNTIQRAIIPAAADGLPAWICVDHEGGRVQRFGAPFTAFPPAAQWGKINSPKTCFEAGYVMARELSAAGVNVNFCPVVDVPADMNSPGLGDRVFSTDPEIVASLGSATARGLQKGGVLGVIKHFPGHGSANVDSHIDLPVCNKTVEELDANDWIPFKRAIRARAEGVMTAHILYPKIDPDRPATLSRRILQDQLRKNLRHAKLIFSDDMDMGAIRKKYELRDAAYFALEAGCDHVLLCHSLDQLEDVWSYLVKAFESGALPRKKIEESWERVSEAKRSYLLPYSERKLAEAAAIVGSPEFANVAAQIKAGHAVEVGPSAKESVE